jgi:hypothetical protein
MEKTLTKERIENMDRALLFQALVGTLGLEKVVDIFTYYKILKEQIDKREE